MRLAAAATLLLAGLALLAPLGDAHANGRPPETNGVFFRPNDDQSIFVRTTFGLLVSRDAGCTFRWACEQNIGYNGAFDPKYAVAADGTIYATTFTGLRVSRDGGCSFTTATAQLPAGSPGRIADIWIDALDIGPTGDVWVATAENGKVNDVYRSTDGGVTFEPRNMASSVFWYKSLVVAPSDPMRVYLAAYHIANPGPSAHLFYTANAGGTWTESPLTGVVLASSPLVSVAAVDPADAQRVYLVSVGANPPEGDRLYRSTNGGAAFTEVLATGQAITNVIVTGTTVLAATGGGTFRSTDGGASFGPVLSGPKLGCLGKRPDGSLIGCAANWEPDFMAVGRSADATQWQKVFRFVELAGPLACPAGTMGHDVCDAQLWPNLKTQFGATGPTCGAAPDMAPSEGPPSGGGGCCDAGAEAPVSGGLCALLLAWPLRRRRAPRATAPRRSPAS